jgi:flagellar biosynthesis protein FlhB
MELIKIIYEPHFIIIVISIIIATVTYFLLKNDKKNQKESKEQPKNTLDIGKQVLYSFLISFVSLLIIYYTFNYLNRNNYFQEGGSVKNTSEEIKNNILEKLTIVADDVDCGLLED